ncbi:MAG: hypothetical protein ACE5G8_14050 [Anaerolineae bacterium]
MDTTGLDVLRRLNGRWTTIEAKCAADQTGAELAGHIAALITLLKTAASEGLAAAQTEAAALGQTLRARQHPLSAALEAMFQIRKVARPFLVREYPGVEGFLEGQLQFEAVCNTLLKSISDGYCR